MFQFQSKYVGLLVLLVLTTCTILLRIQSSTFTYTVLAVASILVLNIVLVTPSRLKYCGLLAIYCGYTLFVSVLGMSNLLEVVDYLIDAIYIVLVLIVLTVYNNNTNLREVLTVYTPPFLLISVILGLYMGLQYPLRYSLLVLLDTFSAIIVISSERNFVVGLVNSLLLFIILYATHIVTLNTMVFTLLFSMYVVRVVLVLYRRVIGLRALVLLDILLRPLLVGYL